MEQDKQNLSDMVKATMESWHGRKEPGISVALEPAGA
jgi:hypothetical protein